MRKELIVRFKLWFSNPYFSGMFNKLYKSRNHTKQCVRYYISRGNIYLLIWPQNNNLFYISNWVWDMLNKVISAYISLFFGAKYRRNVFWFLHFWTGRYFWSRRAWSLHDPPPSSWTPSPTISDYPPPARTWELTDVR